MSFDLKHARQNLQLNNLRKLFIEDMGWDRPGPDLQIPYDEDILRLSGLAQKRGFMVFVCPPPADGRVPNSSQRRKIETQVRKSVHEHLIIFTNPDQSRQIWQWVRRDPGRPTTSREYEYNKGQSGEALLQYMQSLAFSFEEEESLGGIVDVTSRVRATFDLERVTRKFYDRFKQEHADFLKFLQGIPEEGMQRWYVSVTLNRLMFVYFIQKKRFLNGDEHYLRTHLEESTSRGKDRFYADFLCPLFFEGFAKREGERSPQMNRLLGQVPYLNGGIFQPHQIEQLHGKKIKIPDLAFKEIFDFFDQYRWHLDERTLRDDNEINPDVLGYIFEKYINQKEMGAYYTKEDITGYISKYTILPYLLDQARKDCAIAFEGDHSAWRLLAVDPLRYIYPAVQKGCDLPLPPEIQVGVQDVARRGGWNKTAPEEFGLPTEIWREVVARRVRFDDVRQKLAGSEIQQVNDLITYNLDIQQFTQDVVEASEGPELLRAFWKALTQIKVLDPTCGSGAFLFAALNILEPLYEACLERMCVFVTELDQSGEKHRPEKFSDFRQTLSQIDQHPNLRYFILKSIIVNNLYGVDIMEEAVEICKLRLFLKLIAQVEEVKAIEPLPDIDFNIRSGNTLVGFTSIEGVQQALTTDSNGQMFIPTPEVSAQLLRIQEEAELANRAFKHFQLQQVEKDSITTQDKADLRQRLELLNTELHRALAKTYGVNADSLAFIPWQESLKPFHWLVDFYGIMAQGGFDVIIGNPPYVEYSKNKTEYHLRGYNTEGSGNLFAFITERSRELLRISSRSGLIVPTGSVSSERMKSLQTELLTNYEILHLSHYSAHGCPSTLFDGAFLRLTIICGKKKASGNVKQHIYSSKYMKWYGAERPYLFQMLSFHPIPDTTAYNSISKIENALAYSIWNKITKQSPLSKLSATSTNRPYFYYYNAILHWMKAFDFLPRSFNERDGVIDGSHYKKFYLAEKTHKYKVIAALNSNLFYLWFVMLSNCRDLTMREIMRFPFQPPTEKKLSDEFEALAHELMTDYISKSTLKVRKQQTTGRMELQEIDPRKSKSIIDKIDLMLALHYGFTEEELDFIINYDIKYRLGVEAEEE